MQNLWIVRAVIVAGAALIAVAATNHHRLGPDFLLEPPSKVVFANSSGAHIHCSAHGSSPTAVEWFLSDDTKVQNIYGLRETFSNGTLYFPPFRPDERNREIHDAAYRCKASNRAGTIASREVKLKSVLLEHYEVKATSERILVGNTAVLSCSVSINVKDFVSVSSWLRNNSIITFGRIDSGEKYFIIRKTGNLHIRSVTAEDAFDNFSCSVFNSLTEQTTQSIAVRLAVQDTKLPSSPKISSQNPSYVMADEGSDVYLTCTAHGYPNPTYRWSRQSQTGKQEISKSEKRSPIQDVLILKTATSADSGIWRCEATNQFGNHSLEINLVIRIPLAASISPSLQVLEAGASVVLLCSVRGSPVDSIRWLRNGIPILPGGKERVRESSYELEILDVQRRNLGIYQCLASNAEESSQASAEIQLKGVPPELMHTFIEQTLVVGNSISMKCSATGVPLPSFKWYFNEKTFLATNINDNSFNIDQYVDEEDDVITHLNITNIDVKDGGMYRCEAANPLGTAQHSARLNVYGPLSIKATEPTKAVDSSDVTLLCPFAGYPITSVKWERQGNLLHSDLRYKVEKDGSLVIRSIRRESDQGVYTCVVTGRNGEEVRQDHVLHIQKPPKLAPFNFPDDYMEGSRAQISCFVTSGDAPVEFAWYKDSQRIPTSLGVEFRDGEFFQMLLFNRVTAEHAGLYTCIARNAVAEANYSAHFRVKVPPRWVHQPEDVDVLIGQPVMLPCELYGYPKPQTEWLKRKGDSLSEFRPVLSHNHLHLFPNGTLYFDSIDRSDKGVYLCRATNGIGSDATKVVFLSVNEPPQFEVGTNNITARRGSSVVLECEVYGDKPIDMSWYHEQDIVEMGNLKAVVSNSVLDSGLRSHLQFFNASGEDSGRYKCHAENAFGNSSRYVYLTIQDKPDPPTFLQASEVQSRFVKLAWKKPYDGNSELLHYILQYTPSNYPHNWSSAMPTNVTLPAKVQSNSNEPESGEVGNLVPATTYALRMLAVNRIDSSDFTETFFVKTQEEAPSEAPHGVYVNSTGQKEMTVYWLTPRKEGWNGELRGYIVKYCDIGAPKNSTKALELLGGDANEAVIINLKRFTTYSVEVSAFNGMGEGPSSVPVFGTTLEGAELPPPSAPIVTETLGTGLDHLLKHTNYSIKVLAFTNAGDGALSEPVTCVTKEDVPESLEEVKATSINAESVLVSWLPPKKPNGNVLSYNVFMREVKRGKRSIVSFKARRDTEKHGEYSFLIQDLVENDVYEFWITAVNGMGESSDSPIATARPLSNSQARIVSFSRKIRQPEKSLAILPCLAVGNPPPKIKWLHWGKEITSGPLYNIMNEGHLRIQSSDASLEGNFSCVARNIYGKDKITYNLEVLLPPDPPVLKLVYSTTSSINVKWDHPVDGGSRIEEYILSISGHTRGWETISVSPELNSYTFENLLCGTFYNIFLMAANKVAKGSPSGILLARTRGDKPTPVKTSVAHVNSTCLELKFISWSDGGCPLHELKLQYRIFGRKHWFSVPLKVNDERVIVTNLSVATWYKISIVAANDAGETVDSIFLATTTEKGEEIQLPPNFPQELFSDDAVDYTGALTLIPVVTFVVLISIGCGWMVKKKREARKNSICSTLNSRQRNVYQAESVFTSDAMRSSEEFIENVQGGLRISPYAPFGIDNNRYAVDSSLDNIDKQSGHKGDGRAKAKQQAVWQNRRDSDLKNRVNRKPVHSIAAARECTLNDSYVVPSFVRDDSSQESEEGYPIVDQICVDSQYYRHRQSACSSNSRDDLTSTPKQEYGSEQPRWFLVGTNETCDKSTIKKKHRKADRRSKIERSMHQIAVE